MLKIQLLGRFHVEQDGEAVDISSRPAQSLLAYLVLTAGTAHRREKLAGLLWPDSSESNARSNLRHALWRVRKSLAAGERYIAADDLTIAFHGDDDVWLDAATLDRTFADEPPLAQLQEAVSVYEGELLPGLYDDWVALERERLQAVYEQKMALFLDHLVHGGRWHEAVEWSERWIALGQVPEPAYRALMVAHAGLGDLAGMAGAYERCVHALDRDLGVEPSEQTRALYERLAAAELPISELAAGAASWQAALEAAPEPGEPPFKGLHYFDEADADLFFGREQLTARMVGHLRSSRFLAVVGASGSGKSSVVRAGLVPSMRHGETFGAARSLSTTGSQPQDRQIHVITPTAHPLESLAVSLMRPESSISTAAALADDMARDPRALRMHAQKNVGTTGGQLILVVDQFEKLFTLCRSEAERQAFVDNLLAAACPQGPGGEAGECDAGRHVMVVIALRADFYAHCAPYPGLREVLEQHQLFVGAMSAEELRRAVEEPARAGDWTFESGLVDLVLQEVQGEPGALPLLSHTLLETWHRRQGRSMTLAGYTSSGGVRGAIAHTANRVLDSLDPEEQEIARRILIRLTELGEGTQDTRRRADLSELSSDSAGASQVESVLNILADARLVTIDEGSVEVAHEVLIREWPVLRDWLDEDRAGIRIHRHLTESAQAWERLERDPGELYRGARLAQASEWAAAHATELNPLEREFLSASADRMRQRQLEREAQRERELEAARRLAEEQTRTAEAEKQRTVVQARATRRLRVLAGALGVLLIVALVSAFLAVQQTGRAERQTERAAQQTQLAEQEAQRAEQQTQLAEQQARIATARELSAASYIQLDADPERSALLALAAVDVTQNADGFVLPEAANALHRAVPALRVQHVLAGHEAQVWGLAYSPDGRRLATAGDDAIVNVWDPETGRHLTTLPIRPDVINDVAFSPDGTRIAVAAFDDTARVWDAVTGDELLVLRGHSNNLLAVAFSPDGRYLATGSGDSAAKIWDAVSGEELHTLSGHEDGVMGIAFSPDSRYVATASQDGSSRVWDADTGRHLLTLTGGLYLADVLFSPDGTRLFTAHADTTVRVWDLAGALAPSSASAGDSPEGSVAEGDGIVPSQSEPALTLAAHTNELTGLSITPDARHLATSSADGTVIVWDLDSGKEKVRLAGHAGWVTNVAFSPDGRHLATTSTDYTARVWDWATPGHEVRTLAGHRAKVNGMALSPDGTRLATTGLDEVATVWDLATGEALLTIAGGGNEPRFWEHNIAFSPDGARVTTVAADGSPRVWDAITGEELASLQGHDAPVVHVDFSHDGTRLVTASEDGTARIWDTVTGDALVLLSGHTAPLLHAVFSPDDTLIATASEDHTAKLWDAVTGQHLFTLSGHSFWVSKTVFSPDGARLISLTMGLEWVPRVWDVATGEQLFTLDGHNDQVWEAVFNRDGTRIVTAGRDATARIWDAATGEELRVLRGHTSTIYHLAFSPDETLIATAGFDGQTRVWDVATGEELLVLTGHTNAVNDVTFSANGTQLITSGDDGTVRIYALPIDQAVTLAQERLTRTWTEEECRQFLHRASDECREAFGAGE